MEASALTQGRSARRTSPVPVPPRMLRVLSDEALVAHVRRGHTAAFEAIFDRHHRPILSFCRHMLGRPEEAEDAVQQTFLSAYDALRADDREIRLRPWLYAIARNASLTILRARRETAELDDEAHRASTEGLADEVQRRDDLRALVGDLAELPTDQRAALVLAELGDLSHAEIAGVVGCEETKVKALVFQARERLLSARQARETDCAEMQETLATATGGVLRRGPVRRHLKICPSCAAYAQEVKRQRAALACVLPVVPSLALKQASLPSAALSSGGAAAAATAGGASSAGGAGAFGALGVTGTKVATAVVAGVVATGGGVAAVRVAQDTTTTPAPAGQRAAAHPHRAAAPHTGATAAGRTAGAPGAERSATGTAAERAVPEPRGVKPGAAPATGPHHGHAEAASGRAVAKGRAAAPGQAVAPGQASRPAHAGGRSTAKVTGRGAPAATHAHPTRPPTAQGVPRHSAPAAARPAPTRPAIAHVPPSHPVHPVKVDVAAPTKAVSLPPAATGKGRAK